MINGRHLLANLASTVVPTIIVFLTIPAYVHILGESRYGVLAIVWVVYGYAGVLDLGMSLAVNNAISRTPANEHEQQGEIIWSAAAVSALVGIVVSVIAAATVPLWHNAMPADIFAQIGPAIPYLVAGIPLLTITSILNGSIEGARRFDVSSVLQIITVLLYQVGPLAVAYFFGPNLSLLIITVVACRGLAMLSYALANGLLFRLFNHISVKLSRIRVFFRFGYGIALVGLLDPLLNRTDQFAVAYLTGPAGVATYNIAVSAVQRMTIVPQAISRTFFPTLSAGKMEEYLSRLIDNESRVMLPWFGLSIVAVALSGLAFRLWLGHEVGEGVAVVARVLIAGLFLNSLAYMPYTALQAEGKGARVMRAHLIELPLFLGLLAALAIPFGAIGAAVAWSFRAGLDFGILWLMCGRPARALVRATAMFVALLVFGLALGSWGA